MVYDGWVAMCCAGLRAAVHLLNLLPLPLPSPVFSLSPFSPRFSQKKIIPSLLFDGLSIFSPLLRHRHTQFGSLNYWKPSFLKRENHNIVMLKYIYLWEKKYVKYKHIWLKLIEILKEFMIIMNFIHKKQQQ